MKTLIELLRENKVIKEQIKKEKGGYGMLDTPHLPEVLNYLKQFRIEKNRGIEQTIYNSELEEYIIEKENIPEELKDILSTQVYFAQGDLRNELKEKHKKKMLLAGWILLDKNAIDEALKQGKKLQVNAIANNDWATIKIDKIYKPHIFNGNYGLMDLKARTRGYNLSQFENAFCKLV